MLIKSNKDKLDVEITIRNRKDNAYNTKVILNFSPNINYVTAKVSSGELLSVTRPFPDSLFVLKWEFFFLRFGLFGIVTALSQEDCTLNHTKVECTIGYPFLGSNVEVRGISFHKINTATCRTVVIFITLYIT